MKWEKEPLLLRIAFYIFCGAAFLSLVIGAYSVDEWIRALVRSWMG